MNVNLSLAQSLPSRRDIDPDRAADAELHSSPSIDPYRLIGLFGAGTLH